MKSLAPKLSTEEKEQKRLWKIYDRRQREYDKQVRQEKRKRNKLRKREIEVLKFMLKTDVLYYHHGSSESMMKSIKEELTILKNPNEKYDRYNAYIWNYQGAGHNTLPRCQFDCIYKPGDTEFETIYDVPRDGSYRFVIYDSGQRGSGSFNYIKPVKVEKTFEPPKVNPGGIVPLFY